MSAIPGLTYLSVAITAVNITLLLVAAHFIRGTRQAERARKRTEKAIELPTKIVPAKQIIESIMSSQNLTVDPTVSVEDPPTVVYEIPLGRYLIETQRIIDTSTWGASGQKTTVVGWEPFSRAYTFEEAQTIADEYADEHRFIEVRVIDTEATEPEENADVHETNISLLKKERDWLRRNLTTRSRWDSGYVASVSDTILKLETNRWRHKGDFPDLEDQ